MPELPEVETVRRDLQDALTGRRLVGAAATGQRTVRRHGSAGPLVARTQGRKVAGVDRRGKYLLVRLDTADVVVVHLGMSGQLRLVPAGTPALAHTHVRWQLDDGRELRFVDPRTFGEVFVAAPGAGGVPAELAHLGPDALEGVPDAASLGRLLAGRRRRIKPLLLDQQVVAGIGNIYADEILWAARIGPDRPAGALGGAALRRLHPAMRDILLAAIAHRGSSIADEQYRDLAGVVGSYQLHHRAYGREGRPCARCGRPIRRVSDGGRSTFSCPRCQR
ncbi:MAG TPA: bifunctional DNA-formamidopyrimidine glycosylase/DNA-(apurinic or apyrimidinic site) lyase [Acidimicrobiales bacterium]|nr:bifunctional DNA-formamidopyrimidine glycosylase/DNA-(apurinic or apyrimidinic site) lyase [Acidimicrobiales bacterium]